MARRPGRTHSAPGFIVSPFAGGPALARDALPKPFAHIPVQSADEGSADIVAIGVDHIGDRRLAALAQHGCDLEFGELVAFRFQPGGRRPAAIGAGRPLRNHAFKPHLVHRLIKRLTVAQGMLAELDRSFCRRDKLPQQFAPLDHGQRAQILAVEMQEIERHEGELCRPPFDRPAEDGEIRRAANIGRDHLAVDDG